jgi:molybdopterin converting factor small subunit
MRSGAAVRISFYGRLVDVFGRNLELDLAAPCSIGELRERLQAMRSDQGLGDVRVRACVNGVFAADSHIVQDADLIEFLAPVSGG